MKQITCETCGGTNLVKQDGVFVCQSCGCKYSLEEAKKLLIEGHVDVTGSTVRIDNVSQLNNLYELARRSREGGNYNEARDYYKKVLLLDPSSWEAYFYTITDTEFSITQHIISTTFELIDRLDNECARKDADSEFAKACIESFRRWINENNEHISKQDILKEAECLNLLKPLASILQSRGHTNYIPEIKKLFEQGVIENCKFKLDTFL